jgi:hypothetical protein
MSVEEVEPRTTVGRRVSFQCPLSVPEVTDCPVVAWSFQEFPEKALSSGGRLVTLEAAS